MERIKQTILFIDKFRGIRDWNIWLFISLLLIYKSVYK